MAPMVPEQQSPCQVVNMPVERPRMTERMVETPTPPPPQWWPSWEPQRHQSSRTVIIFDWDDTLLCTTTLALLEDQCQDAPEVLKQHLSAIEDSARRLLEFAMQLGHTFIITNAMHGWVEYSAAKYVPNLLPILQNIRVISARTKYESQYPGEVCKWKVHAFLDVQRQLNSENITNLISLGDSECEMDAIQVMGRLAAQTQKQIAAMDPCVKECAQVLVKTIKFREDPEPEELWKQLELVTQNLDWIVENDDNLQICLEQMLD